VLSVLGTAACSPLQISEPSPVRYQLAPPELLIAAAPPAWLIIPAAGPVRGRPGEGRARRAGFGPLLKAAGLLFNGIP